MAEVEILVLANFLIALFVFAFGLFSVRTVWHSKRRVPWILLLVLGFILFATQSINLLATAGYFSQYVLRPAMDLIFLIVMLFTVVFQYNLIVVSQKGHT